MLQEPLNLELPPPSLKNMSYAKLALLLWSTKNFQAVMKAMKSNEKYHETTNGLESIIVALPLPTDCKTILKDFLYMIWGSLNTWTSEHEKYWNTKESPFSQIVYQHLIWTSRGSVNSEKSAENLIKYDTLSVAFRYRLSCLYCLEDDIPKIWSAMIPSDFHGFCPLKIKNAENKLVTYWTYTIMGLSEELIGLMEYNEDNLSIESSLLKYVIMYQGRSRNVARFFHERCSQAEQQLIFNHFKNNLPPLPKELLLFLSLSNKDQQQEILAERDGVKNFLGCLLSWPWLDMYVRSFAILKDYIDDECFLKLMLDIIRPITFTLELQETSRIFELLWEGAQESRRRYVLAQSDELLLDIVRFKHRSTEKLILESLTNLDERKVICDKLVRFKKMWESYLE